MPSTRFNELSASYEDLLRDPLRDRFKGSDSLFFHRRKSELIRRFFNRRHLETGHLRYLDLGCGKGELLQLLRADFGHAAGCDVSEEMMRQIAATELRVQTDPLRIPFEDAVFDLVTAACVYHHVPPESRPALTEEVWRVLKPGGVFCMIEHNPRNPVTRRIVSRTRVDSDAILVPFTEALSLARNAGLHLLERSYFLYFPSSLYRFLGGMEALLSRIPLGGQYALFSRKDSSAKRILDYEGGMGCRAARASIPGL